MNSFSSFTRHQSKSVSVIQATLAKEVEENVDTFSDTEAVRSIAAALSDFAEYSPEVSHASPDMGMGGGMGGGASLTPSFSTPVGPSVLEDAEYDEPDFDRDDPGLPEQVSNEMTSEEDGALETIAVESTEAEGHQIEGDLAAHAAEDPAEEVQVDQDRDDDVASAEVLSSEGDQDSFNDASSQELDVVSENVSNDTDVPVAAAEPKDEYPPGFADYVPVDPVSVSDPPEEEVAAPVPPPASAWDDALDDDLLFPTPVAAAPDEEEEDLSLDPDMRASEEDEASRASMMAVSGLPDFLTTSVTDEDVARVAQITAADTKKASFVTVPEAIPLEDRAQQIRDLVERSREEGQSVVIINAETDEDGYLIDDPIFKAPASPDQSEALSAPASAPWAADMDEDDEMVVATGDPAVDDDHLDPEQIDEYLSDENIPDVVAADPEEILREAEEVAATPSGIDPDDVRLSGMASFAPAPPPGSKVKVIMPEPTEPAASMDDEIFGDLERQHVDFAQDKARGFDEPEEDDPHAEIGFTSVRQKVKPVAPVVEDDLFEVDREKMWGDRDEALDGDAGDVPARPSLSAVLEVEDLSDADDPSDDDLVDADASSNKAPPTKAKRKMFSSTALAGLAASFVVVAGLGGYFLTAGGPVSGGQDAVAFQADQSAVSAADNATQTAAAQEAQQPASTEPAIMDPEPVLPGSAASELVGDMRIAETGDASVDDVDARLAELEGGPAAVAASQPATPDPALLNEVAALREALTGFTAAMEDMQDDLADAREQLATMEAELAAAKQTAALQGEILGVVASIQEEMELDKMRTVSMMDRIIAIEEINIAREARAAAEVTVSAPMSRLEDRIDQLNTNIGIIARMAAEGAMAGGARPPTTVGAPPPQPARPGDVFTSTNTSSSSAGFTVTSNANPTLRDVKIGDFVEGYGMVLAIQPASTGGKVVMMENGAIFVD